MIDCFASRPHYLRHCLPVLEALGPDAGTVTTLPGKLPRGATNPVMLAGASDLDRVIGRPVILVEHGAGQRYVGLDHRSWSGGSRRDKVGLFLCPRQDVADANLAAYPDAEAVVVGCPALDKMTGPSVAAPVVAFTFHPTYPAARHIPELRSALGHYVDALPGIVGRLRGEGLEVAGHFHPRFRALRNLWRRSGVAVVEDWDDVLGRAAVVVADNTSALPEAAGVGRGTVWLNAPWYRREVDHGGRFWDWPAFGTMVDGPGQVIDAVLAEVGGSRSAGAMEAVYTFADGRASERSASAIRAWWAKVAPTT